MKFYYTVHETKKLEHFSCVDYYDQFLHLVHKFSSQIQQTLTKSCLIPPILVKIHPVIQENAWVPGGPSLPQALMDGVHDVLVMNTNAIKIKVQGKKHHTKLVNIQSAVHNIKFVL